MRKSRKIFLGLAVAAALASSAVSAQPFPAGGPGWGPYGGGGPGMMGPRGMMGPGMGPGGYGPMGRSRFGPGFAGGPGFSVDARLAALKAELKITGNQESAWNGYTKQVKQQFESTQVLLAKTPPATQSAPDRMAQRAEFAKQRAGNLDATSTAVKNLYAALTAEQKTLADQYLAGGGRGRFGGRGPWR
jgi:periplasmic protein CpxP/Spy